MCADLVSGRYGQRSVWQTITGNLGNATQSDLPVRSNVEDLGSPRPALGAALVANNSSRPHRCRPRHRSQ